LARTRWGRALTNLIAGFKSVKSEGRDKERRKGERQRQEEIDS